MSPPRPVPDVDVCVVGSFMTDFSARVARRPTPGETVIGEALDITLGGKGFNQAVAAVRSGAVTRMHGCLGRDEFATSFRSALAGEGIHDDTVIDDPHEGTGMGFPVLDRTGQNTIIVVPRANGRIGPDAFTAAERAAASCRVLLIQLEVPFELSVHAARVARAAGATVVLNPAPAGQPPAAFAGLADVLVPNRTEVAQLVGRRDVPADEAAERLRRLTGSAVIVTLDAEGVLVLGSDDAVPHHFPAHPVASVDTIGAGDAFCGALGARLALGDDLLTASTYANAAGAICVTRAGAAQAIPLYHEVRELMSGAGAQKAATPQSLAPG